MRFMVLIQSKSSIVMRMTAIDIDETGKQKI